VFQPYYSELIAVSSFKPLDKSPEIAANQLRAKASWDLVFTRVFLFGDFDKRLASPGTEFIPSEDWPTISALTLVASWQEHPTCLLNADIVVSPGLKDVLNHGWKRGAQALTSKRAEFEPTTGDLDRARVVDMGADFFAAFPWVWAQVHKTIPPSFRLGHSLWDSWLLGFLNHFYPQRFFDMTNLRPIFHPRHGERHAPHVVQVPPDCFYEQPGFPPML
jgi:hypothetical protein